MLTRGKATNSFMFEDVTDDDRSEDEDQSEAPDGSLRTRLDAVEKKLQDLEKKIDDKRRTKDTEELSKTITLCFFAVLLYVAFEFLFNNWESILHRIAMRRVAMSRV